MKKDLFEELLESAHQMGKMINSKDLYQYAVDASVVDDSTGTRVHFESFSIDAYGIDDAHNVARTTLETEFDVPLGYSDPQVYSIIYGGQ